MRTLSMVFVVSMFVATAAADWNPATGGTFTWNGNSFETHTNGHLTANSGTTNAGFHVSTDYGSLPRWGSGTNLFRTYCIEQDITFVPGTTYWMTWEPNAYSGNDQGGPSGDPVSAATEWVYCTYIMSNPHSTTGFTYFIDGQNRTFDLAEIRDVIWALEGEIAAPTGTNDRTRLYNYALTNYPGNSSGRVLALNLWTVNAQGVATDRQSHLIYVPVPGAALLGVLGLGIAGWLKRRMA